MRRRWPSAESVFYQSICKKGNWKEMTTVKELNNAEEPDQACIRNDHSG